MFRWLALAILVASTAFAAPPTQQPSGAPRILRLALPSSVSSLDPQVAYDELSLRIVCAAYDTLLTYDPFKTAPCELIPCILEAIPKPEPAPGGMVSYLFKLKPGVKFHDAPCFPGGKGRGVSAADVHYAFQRICDPALDSPFYSVFAENIVGIKEARSNAEKNGGRLDYDKHKVSGIEVIDPLSFKIRLTRPWPQLLHWLANAATAPVAREAVEYYDGKNAPPFAIHPVGTGPFRLDFENSDPRALLRLVRNEHYTTMRFPKSGWPADRAEGCAPLAGKPLPLLDAVEFHVLETNRAAWQKFQDGLLDELPLNPDVHKVVMNGEGELLAAQSRRGMTLERKVDPSTFFFVFNMADPLIGKNKKLRQALSSAYDSHSYVRTFFGGNVAATQLIPPGIPGHDPQKKNPYSFDLERAKKLMAEAGYPEGKNPQTGKPLEITLEAVTSSGENRRRTEFDKLTFEKLGITVKVAENDYPTFLNKKDKGQFQIASGSGWGADYPDAENFYFLFYSKHHPPAGRNDSRYHHPEFDTLFEKMSPMPDGPERLAIIQKMADILAEDCPLLLTFHKAKSLLGTPWAKRTHLHPILDGLQYLTTDPERREALMKDWTR